jgi:cation transport regulator ChaB
MGFKVIARSIPINEESEQERPDTFDLSDEVELNELDDADLLFRESIIKAFYETAQRTGKPAHGYTKLDLEKMQLEIIEEFQNRGRDYIVPLDRSFTDETIKRDQNLDMKNLFGHVDGPEEVLNILDKEYKSCRIQWLEDHPTDVEDNFVESGCVHVAWQAVKDAGYFVDTDGIWKKRGEKDTSVNYAKSAKKSKEKEIVRFVSDPEVRLRKQDFETAKCEYCQYFSNQRCHILEHMVQDTQVCDAYSGNYFYGDSDHRRYTINNFNGFLSGLSEQGVLNMTIVRSLDSPAGVVVIMKDNMKPVAHYFSVTMSEFIEQTVNKHHWTQAEVDFIAGSGGFNNVK